MSDNDSSLPEKSSNKQRSSQSPTTNKDLLVYVLDLPSDLPDNDIDQRVKTHIETKQRVTIIGVQCYLKLGIAVLQMMNEEDKNHLISNVESMVFDKQRGITISFVDKLDFDSYIVLDRNVSKIPSSNEVAHRCALAYKTQEIRVCESISVQFPNIFRISLKTLDECVEAANTPDFKIDNSFATVYPRADCSFFEDLPSNINDEKLSSAISAQIGEKELPATSFYVQYNKQTGNAVVVAVKSVKKWITEGHLVIDGRNISKKAKLAYRILISPIPPNFDINQILNHKLFANRIVTHKHINDHLILELDDMTKYEDCLSIGAFRIEKDTMQIIPYTNFSDPNTSEINAVNWYETAMLDIKPDITTIMNNYEHPILHYKWNAKNWLEQMRKAEEPDRHSKKYDLNRHLLRVTVMLNTISILRQKKYIIDGEEVILKPERMRTISYDHKSKLSYGKKISRTEMKIPYTSTTVKVINEDCLILYEKLVSEGHRPLLLNMANATSPGGGYRKGDGAQEENLFRRSNYYHSLDLQLADKDQSERLYCTSKCEVKRPTSNTSLYPMEEFGAIYTSGITVFRQTEENGYDYMKKPLYNVCAIAMAAYRDPQLNDKNMLENKFALNTHKKIENIFAIAYHHKHDCLVLSAFGCGAFKNPPEHIALLFKSIIYQYAGYFNEIYFAIVDDHNTGNRINPKGNLQPFQNILNGLIVHPLKTLRINGISGPYRILDKSSDEQLNLSDVCILYLPLCQHGSKCRDLKNTQHNSAYSHPPMCSYQDTISTCDQMNDEVHMFTYIHNVKCQYGGECKNKDSKHLSEFDHPEFCKDQIHCIDMSPEHLLAYRHLPICRDGITCMEYLRSNADHCNEFRHCRTICPYDNCCANFHDKKHMENTIHSFRKPCPFTPYNCSMYVKYVQVGNAEDISSEVENHCLQYSHVCPFGRLCRTTEEKHYITSIHIARKLCSDLDKCSKLAEESHLESFSHPGIRDIRLLCKDPGYRCHGRLKELHLKKYRHGQNHNQLSVAPSSNLNSSINFFHNQGQIIKTVNNYVNTSGWKKAKVSSEIVNWIRALQPVHRCAKHIFESILVHGHVMSRHYMNLLKKPKYVAKAVQQHGRIRLIFLQHNIPEVKHNVKELIKLLVQAEFSKKGADAVPPLDPDHNDNVNIIEKKLKPPLNDHDIDIIRMWAVKIAEASIKLHTNPMGIGFDVDEKLKTDNHVFSILGPHHGYYYGDIVITFKQEIMFHPDANFSIQAGTSFHSGRVYKLRPWLKDSGNEDQRIQHFHYCKLHCSIPRYEYAAAVELTAFTGKDKQSMDINIKDVIDRWPDVDSHDVFEGHLPQLIPLDYIDNVYMPKNIFESLSHEAQQSAKAVLKDSLIISHNHQVDLSILKPGVLTPLDPTRKPYLKFILDKINEKIKERIDAPQISRGIVITIPGTKFEDHIILPMTISQSYDLYCLDKVQASKNLEFTYIYWQTMNGDMMITISNEKIESSAKDQPNLRCLICYVAEKPSTATQDYHEAYSYLNIGRPYQHYTNVHSSNFKAKSNVFYHGCNTDDFFTFCLKLSHKTGEVTLSHAGPNGIYNHEKIYYQFNKSDMDLSRIDYIHLSGGEQDVPIRNLTIRHELVHELHPSFDKEFKINTSDLLKKRRASVNPIVHAPYHSGEHNKNIVASSHRQRSASVQPKIQTKQAEESSFFQRLKNAIFCKSIKTVPLTDKSPVTHPSSDKSPSTSSPPISSSKLPPCHDSVYCLEQNSKEHIAKYSHLCRFNELCRNHTNEPHLIHQHHGVPKCKEDKNCSKLTDPVHRAEYRHTNLPDYLYPCRHQDVCYDKSLEHRKKYFHGEELPSIKKNKTTTTTTTTNVSTHLYPCKYGANCRSKTSPQHLAKYSHPSS